MSEVEIVLSNQNRNKLCLNGNLYTIQHSLKNKIRWRCTKRTSLNCPSVLKTDLDFKNPQLIKEHNHPVDTEEVTVVKCLRDMKDSAKKTQAKPTEIYLEAMNKLSPDTRARMPTEDSVKRTLRNQKKRKRPISPVSLNQLKIEGDWRLTDTAQNKRFLLYDNGTSSQERIIIFGTDYFLKILANSNEWYMDGNTNFAPHLFHQLYMIRVRVENEFITAVYGLLERHTRLNYERFFSALVEECEKKKLHLTPKTLHVNYEDEVNDAVKNIFGDHVYTRGCFYHLCQSTQKKIQTLELEKYYRENECFNQFCGMLNGLAFLPPNDIPKAMDILINIMPSNANDLVSYFDKTFVHGRRRCPKKRIPPLFPPSGWSIHNVILNNCDQIKIQIEGWNYRYSKLNSQSQCTIWQLIDKMRLEVSVDELKIKQSKIGKSPTVKRIEIHNNVPIKLKQICNEYNDKKLTLEKFLKEISEIIRRFM